MTIADEALDVIMSVNEIFIALALIAVGGVLCFWGGLFARKIIFLVGFFAGALFAYLCLNNVAEASSSRNVHLLISCGVGLFVGCVCMWVYVSAIFVLGAIAGVIFAQLLWHAFVASLVPSSSSSYADLIFVVVCGLAVGMFAFVLEKIIMKGLTAFTGSFMIVSGLSFFVMKYIMKDNSTNALEFRNFFSKTAITHNYEGMVSLIVWIALCVCGICYQYKLYKYCNDDSQPSLEKTRSYEKLNEHKIRINS